MPLTDPDRAIQETRYRVHGARVATRDRMLPISTSGHSGRELDSIGWTLNQFISFPAPSAAWLM